MDSDAAQMMTLDGNMANAGLQTSLSDGEHDITVEVRDVNGLALARGRTRVQLRNQEAVALAVERSEPANNTTRINTNDVINIYFSRAIDPALLQVEVKESVHGRTYDFAAQQGKGLGEMPPPKQIEVYKDMAVVTGAVTHYPGYRYVSFNPGALYTYGADIYVTVKYNNTDLSRFRFKVKPLPSLLAGHVSDHRGVPLSGVRVEIAELGLSTQTDEKGNYVLHSEKAAKKVSTGRYALVVNSEMANPRIGVTEVWTNIQAGELNSQATIRVPLLSRDVSFVYIRSGDATVLLDSGNLTLDLSSAQLRFANGRTSGNVHVQFLTLSELAFAPTAAMPHWMYNLQPGGIEVEGDVDIRIKMPLLYGSDAYIPAEGYLVVLVGLNAQSKMIEPVGVGQISNKVVVSVNPVSLDRLDYLGYALVSEAGQAVLQRYVNNDIHLSVMASELEHIAETEQ